MILLLLSTAAALPLPPPVVGGGPATPGDWPDTGALFVEDLFACTAVLIEPDLLLTAAHCMGGPFLSKGVWLDTVDHASGGGVWVDVREGFEHPDPFNTFDLAVFVLEEPAPVAPRRLLLDCLVDDYLAEGSEVTIVGFGATDEAGRQPTTKLNEARTTVQIPACDRSDRGCNLDVAPDGELIAGGDGVDSCSGDSGGPLYIHTPRGDFLAGITSRAALPTDTPCGNGGIYVRADAVADWVETVTGRTLTRPACEGVNRPPSPFAPPLRVPLGGSGETRIDPGDPNEDDAHTFELVEGATVGAAAVSDDGLITYQSWRIAFVAPDLVVRVTDSQGEAALLTVPVDILVPAGGQLDPHCGCRTSGPGSVSWLVFGVPGLVLTRRRRRHGLPGRRVEARVGSAWPHPSIRRA